MSIELRFLRHLVEAVSLQSWFTKGALTKL